MKNKNWFFIHHHPDQEEAWSTPKGFILALRDSGIKVFDYSFVDPNNFFFPSNKYFIDNEISVAISFYAGKNEILEEGLSKIKQELNIIIINELGDEPQTLSQNARKVEISDISLTPDYRSSLYWRNQGHNCYWFNHWADTAIFNSNIKSKKVLFVGTSIGRRKYSLFLKILLGNSFLNKRCSPKENALIYKKSKIVFQYARWNEITRRIFEAAACNCCILTNRLPEYTQIETIFAHNVSAIYYSGPLNLMYQLIRLKIKPNLHKEIAYNAYKIVHKNHTQKSRAHNLIRLVNEFPLKK